MGRWLVTDLYNPNTVQPQQGQLDRSHQISINNTMAMKILKPTYYWSAPEPYLGNKVSFQIKRTASIFLLYNLCNFSIL